MFASRTLSAAATHVLSRPEDAQPVLSVVFLHPSDRELFASGLRRRKVSEVCDSGRAANNAAKFHSLKGSVRCFSDGVLI